MAAAQAEHEAAIEEWKANLQKCSEWGQQDKAAHTRAEQRRLAALKVAREKYAAECAERDAEQERQNLELDRFIANLSYGDTAAVQEYVGIVLSNSVYPDCFQVEHEFQFAPSTAELKLMVTVPEPQALPDTKSYKYSKSSDEIVETKLSNKACRDRYASAVHQVAVRTLHEVFEADRRGLVKTISLEVGTKAVNPATGLKTDLLFVAVGVAREAFLRFDLSAVVPSATLSHLGASLSKNPHELVPARADGMRRA